MLGKAHAAPHNIDPSPLAEGPKNARVERILPA
jgi:hypothetical protein